MTHDETTETNATDFFELPDDEAPSKPPPRRQTGKHSTPRKALPLILLQDALTGAELRRVREARSLLLLVKVPSPAWVESVRDALRALGSWHEIEVRDGSTRYRRKPEDVGEVAVRIGDGLRVAAVCHDPAALLPPSLIACADISVALGPPSDRVIRRAIKAVTGTMPRRVPHRAGLDFADLVGCIRVGDTAAAAVRRLSEASQARLGTASDLADVPHVLSLHGYGAATAWASNLLKDLEDWRAGRLDFSCISRTLLLVSEPGLGKTTWARSLAKSAHLPFLTLSISSLFSGGSGYLGEISTKIDQFFALARNMSPAVVFLDEIDALPSRDNLDNRNRDYWLPLIVQFLLLLDSSASSATSRLIIIAATNHGGAVDPALCRAGRLHPTITLGRPDAMALAAILRQHLAGDLADADLSGIVALGRGRTGADVVAWVRDARRVARAASRPMRLDDLRDVVAPPDSRSDTDRWRAAVHEAGHGLGATYTGSGRVTHLDIVAAGHLGGRTLVSASQTETRSRTDIEATVVTALSGRAAEVALGLQPTSGASEDLRIATELLVAMHVSYGLGEGLVHRAAPGDSHQVLAYDPALRARIDEELHALNQRALDLAVRHRALIEDVASALLRERVLDEAGFAAIVAAHLPGEVRHG
ncbi:AAA family ATPase [Methylorubrum sp. DB1722]|uniref:AAA family ATPase n=1 Tax=Methylorubrum sp. DB1722 TaxID=2478916 RepID=UPI0018E2B98D|nr:AAA family ATPase [Methylorubrum sp. DB1722]